MFEPIGPRIASQLIEEAEAALSQAQDLVKMTGSRAAAE